MIPKIAVLYSAKSDVADKKIGGLYLLERNIRLLWHAGTHDLFLKLDKNDELIYRECVQKRVASLKEIRIRVVSAKDKIPGSAHLSIPSNYFLQYQHLTNFAGFFRKKGSSFVPTAGDDRFPLCTSDDIRRAEKVAMNHIRLSAGGVIARTINKRISLPISLVLSRLRIHPNAITFANMILMLFGASLLLRDSYWWLLLSGLIFNAVSIFDGCDGEVAKLTCRFSKFGAMFDTFNDYLCLVVYLAGISYIYYHKTGLVFSIISIATVFVGLFILIVCVILYLVRFSESKSFVAYSREFLNKLPKSDRFVRTASLLEYFIRKEFYSWVGFIFSIIGLMHLMVLYTAVTVFVASILCVVINARYFPKLSKETNHKVMTYISRRS